MAAKSKRKQVLCLADIRDIEIIGRAGGPWIEGAGVEFGQAIVERLGDVLELTAIHGGEVIGLGSDAWDATYSLDCEAGTLCCYLPGCDRAPCKRTRHSAIALASRVPRFDKRCR
jgi:hypothetical protein